MSMRIYSNARGFSHLFSALADESRLRLLSLMREGEICVCHFQTVLQTNQPKVSRHLAYLRRAGLVEARRDGKWMHYGLKKLEPPRDKILRDTLRQMADFSDIKRDARRLQQIHCCPPETGISRVLVKTKAPKAKGGIQTQS